MIFPHYLFELYNPNVEVIDFSFEKYILRLENESVYNFVHFRYTTISYRSPEMIDLYGGKAITTKADIWVCTR